MRWGDHSAKNRELYEATVNRTNNTCATNPYRTLYLQALHKKNMKQPEEKFVCPHCGADWGDAEMIGDPEFNDLWKCDKCKNEYNSAVLVPICGKPHNNGDDTCNECEVIKKNV